MERRSGVAWLVSGMVLVPYATVLLPFELALYVQAGLIVAVLAVVAWGGRGARRQAGNVLPGPIRVGLALYAAAALWGVTVGVLAGNPTRFVASQFLSMALLPTAALAFAVRRDLDGDTFMRGLAWAAIVALTLHVAAFFAPALAGEVPGHFGFDLRNNVGAAGVAPLIWLLGLAWTHAGSQQWSVAVPCAAAVLCVWGQSRGAWVSAFIGSLVLLLLMARRPGRAITLASGVALVPVVMVLAIGFLATRPDGGAEDARSVAVPTPLRIEASVTPEYAPETEPARAFAGAALQISARSQGDRGAHLWVRTDFADAGGRPLARRWVEVVGAGHWTHWEALVAAPPEARSFRIGFWVGQNQGTWLVEGVNRVVVRSRIEALGRQVLVRFSSFGHALVDPAADGALAYRMAESRAVLALWSSGSVLRRLAGFGLGATFAFPNASFDGGGRIVVPTASYIHDLYLFLLFKLGVVGAVALAGLGLIVGWMVRSAMAVRGSFDRQWLLAGAAAGWFAYLVWGVTSPEIYDFRLAPLWGALVAACCREVGTGTALPVGTGTPRAPGGPRAAFAVELLRSDDALLSLRPEWDGLLAGSRSETVALTWPWLATWWDLYRDGPHLALLTVRDPNGSLVGVAPFAARSARTAGAFHVQRLELLGTGEPQRDAICSEYLDVISRRENEAAVVDAIADHLTRTRGFGWDEIVMASTRPGSVAAGLASAMASRGFRTAAIETERGPAVHLPDEEAAVSTLLSPPMRRKLAYYLRKLEAAGGVEFKVCRSESELETGLDHLIALHQKRWTARNRRGCFASERFGTFHRRIAPILLREGRVALYSLSVGGTVVYVLYGFRDGTTLLAYQSGFDPDFDKRVSLGLVMLHHCLRQAVTEGVRDWDFLRGEEPYKTHWATDSRPILELHLWNATPTAVISRHALLARLAARRLLRRFRLTRSRRPR